MKIKNKCSISECLKFIEVKSNALFLSTFGVKIDVKNKGKRVSRMCENAYLSIKNPKASRALKRALDPGRKMLASLARLRFATSATFGLRSWGPPLDQILDPHLNASYLYSLQEYKGMSLALWVLQIELYLYHLQLKDQNSEISVSFPRLNCVIVPETRCWCFTIVISFEVV